MRNSAILSATMHVVLIGFMYFGLPIFQDPEAVNSPPVIEVEFAQVADVTNMPPPEPEKTPEPTPEPPPQPPKPPPAAKNEPEPEPELEEEEVVALPEEPEPEEKEPEVKPEPVKKEPPPPPKVRPQVAQKKPQKPDKKEKKFDPNRIAALLDKKISEKAPAPSANTETDEAAPAQPNRTQPTPQRIAAPVTISERDRIKAHIIRNWNPNQGAQGADRMEVQIRIFLKSDGSLSRPPEVVGEVRAGQDDQVFRPFAESAIRAVLKSDPLPVPLNKYESWRQIDFTFSLKDMLG